ncbi:SDR family NAD(P)-dependent oxidoreductase [Pseudolysinimonas kribbensis]|uniref:Oxidoreductase n=1 Tax=Pseudolysinimonas kribbensis TaxID=433641 RepID=A0ABQ6K6W3_9MICO|nr:SDR family NAD(P)-dependent oxidoreductase [Pseudolysinimonas kribbensis]GMA95283.1 oxidoreductase [Pseudolysinimonas kribbensis]
MSWDPDRLPDQHGRTVVVTGGNAGIGARVSEQLAGAGARVVLASRSPERAQATIDGIRDRVPGAALALVRLDLASLDSIRTAAAELRALGRIDVLVNNAGRTDAVRRRETTDDGLELIVGTNAFGAFALTALVAPALADDGRVVWLGSFATKLVRGDVSDLQSERRYAPFRAYGLSKHATQALGFELDRRWRAAGSARRSLVAHPGFALDRGSFPLFLQSKERGAWPVVRAAIDPDAEGGTFWGPHRGLVGRPAPAKPVASSADPAFGAEVWRQAEAATGVAFPIA